MVDGEGEKAADALAAVEASYQKGVHDEFVLPCDRKRRKPVATIQPGDGVIFFNFRPDRPGDHQGLCGTGLCWFSWKKAFRDPLCLFDPIR